VGGVARRSHEHPADGQVRDHEAVRLAQGRGHRRDVRAHRSELVRARPLRREAHGFDRDRAPELHEAREEREPAGHRLAREYHRGEVPEEIEPAGLAVVEDPRARAVDRVDEPLVLEVCQGRPQGQARHTQRLGQLALAGEALPDDVVPREDP